MKTPKVLSAGILAGLYLTGIAAFNDQTKLFTAAPGKPEACEGFTHGTVLAANDANFDQEYIKQPLEDYIVGAPDEDNLAEVLEQICPSIPVGRAFTYRTHNTVEQYQDDSADDGDIREIGGEFQRLRTTGAQADGRTDNKGLTMVLDNDQGGELQEVQQRAALNLKNRLLRSDLRRVITALDANDTDVALNLGASNTTCDVDGDIISELDLGGDARGVDGNVVVFGKSAAIKRILSYRRPTNTSRGAEVSLQAKTPQELAALLNVDRAVVLPFRYQSSSSAKSKILGDAIFSYAAKSGLMPDDPSNIKRFTTGTGLRVYVQPLLKRTLVTVEHYSRVIVTSTLGIRKKTITFT